jgi:hypothetical protein
VREFGAGHHAAQDAHPQGGANAWGLTAFDQARGWSCDWATGISGSEGQLLLGGVVRRQADGDGYAVVLEHGGDLQAPAEGFDVGAQAGEVDLAAVLHPGDVALADAELGGEVDLGDVARFAQLA